MPTPHDWQIELSDAKIPALAIAEPNSD